MFICIKDSNDENNYINVLSIININKEISGEKTYTVIYTLAVALPKLWTEEPIESVWKKVMKALDQHPFLSATPLAEIKITDLLYIEE